MNNLLVISRNMLAIKETAQEICATVQFDKAVQKLIVLCVNVTSKGYDGENVDEGKRGRLNEITELCKLSICDVFLGTTDCVNRQETPGYLFAAYA